MKSCYYLLICASIGLLIAPTAQGELFCSPGYTLYFGDNSCYGVFGPQQGYALAVKTCKKDGGDLVSIHDVQTDYFVSNLDTGSLLIGLQYDKPTDSYHWSDGTPVDYTNYDSTFTSMRDYLGYCAKIDHHKWVNAQCEEDNLKFVCRKSTFNQTSAPTDQCPDPNNIYYDKGTILSPRQPQEYNGPLRCVYKLASHSMAHIKVTFNQTDLAGRDTISLYKSWDMTPANYIKTVTSSDQGFSATVSSSNALVFFSGNQKGKWSIIWTEA